MQIGGEARAADGRNGSSRRSPTWCKRRRPARHAAEDARRTRPTSTAGRSSIATSHAMSRAGTIAAGEALRVELAPPVVLPNGGGVKPARRRRPIGRRVSYTAQRAAETRRTIVF
jgi:hypothetical protein